MLSAPLCKVQSWTHGEHACCPWRGDSYIAVGSQILYRVECWAVPGNLSKSRAQAFLASRPEHVLSVGVAAKKDYWEVEGPAFQPVVEALRAAFP